MTSADKKVLEKIANLNGEIASRQNMVRSMNRVLSNYKNLQETSDVSLNLNSLNDKYHSPANFFSISLGEVVDRPFPSGMAFVKDHLREIRDPLIDGLIKIDDDDYTVLSFGEVHTPDLLNRFLKRQLPMNEYLSHISGEVPVASKDGKDYFIERPENYNEIVEECRISHPNIS